MKLFDDSNEMLRLKHHFGNATSTIFDKKCSIILRSKVTKLIIQNAHNNTLHQGVEPIDIGLLKKGRS